MSKKETFRVNHFQALESGYRFNMERVYEMHNLLRMVASMQDMPNCSNPIVLNVIKDCKEYIDKWGELSDSYPGGIPVVYPHVDIQVDGNTKDVT
jgi:hypothetical protein